jgi:hypothetical protein
LISSPARRFHQHAYARVSTRIIRVASATSLSGIIISAVVVPLLRPLADQAPRSWRAIKHRSRSSRGATPFRLATGSLPRGNRRKAPDPIFKFSAKADEEGIWSRSRSI